MNENKNIKILFATFFFIFIIGAYYIGYMSAQLGLSAPFIPNKGVVREPSAPKDVPEMKLVEEVSPISLTGDEVSIGNQNSKYVMVTFTDFECPFCARFHPGLSAVQKATDAKLVFKHFPLSFHQNAKNFANMFECIAKNTDAQKAVAFADDLFAENLKSQGQIDLQGAKKIAYKYVNDQNLQNCSSDSSITIKIENHFKQGIELGIQGTPALYIMNTESGKAVRINGALDQSALQAEFDKIK